MLIGEDGSPVPSEAYIITPGDGPPYKGVLDENGRARIDDLDPEASCTVEFPELDRDAWGPA